MRSVTRLLRNPWLLGLVGALLAWLNIGVDVAGPDQQLYIPYIRHFAHPELYAGDYIFDSDNYRATLFVPLVGTLHRLVGGDLVPLLYIVHALSLFTLFSGLAAATARVTRGAAPAWVVALLSWPPSVPGAATALWEPSPHPRTLAVALAVWALRHALDGRALPTAALAVAATLVHPLLGGAALLGGALALTVGARRSFVIYLVAVAALLAGARLILPLSTSLPLRPVGWWLDVATAGFLWVQQWGLVHWASFAAWCALFAFGARAVEGATGARLVRFGLASLPLMALAFGGMLLRSPLIVSLQVHRSFYVLMIVAVIAVAAALEQAHERGELPLAPYVAAPLVAFTHSVTLLLAALFAVVALASVRRAPALVGTALAVVFVGVTGLRFRPHRVHPPSPNDDWIALQRWAAQSTPTDARFLAPRMLPDFRVFSSRASVVGAQDEQPVIFNRALADAWQSRRHALDGYAAHDCGALDGAARRYGAAYVVADFDCGRPAVHRQGRFVVYDGARMAMP
jgi:uncharacterized protein DUF6798